MLGETRQPIDPRHVEGVEIPSERTPILIAGLPGKMASAVAVGVENSEHFSLLGTALSGSAMGRVEVPIYSDTQFRSHIVTIVPTSHHEAFLSSVQPGTIAIDFTRGGANTNAEMYARAGIPFVMGTTGGDRFALVQTVRMSEISAVIAPNMAGEVVKLQQELSMLPENHFVGHKMRIRESHQASKADVSGTAVALQRQLEALGAVMDGEVESVRDPEQQRRLGIPNEHLEGHAYHWISVQSPDGSVTREWRTAINGRELYVANTLEAVRFLKRKMAEGSRGEVFSMIDVMNDSKK